MTCGGGGGKAEGGEGSVLMVTTRVVTTEVTMNMAEDAMYTMYFRFFVFMDICYRLMPAILVYSQKKNPTNVACIVLLLHKNATVVIRTTKGTIATLLGGSTPILAATCTTTTAPCTRTLLCTTIIPASLVCIQ